MKKLEEQILKAKKKVEQLEEAKKMKERKFIYAFFGKILKDKDLEAYLEDKVNNEKFKSYLLEKIKETIIDYTEEQEGEANGE